MQNKKEEFTQKELERFFELYSPKNPKIIFILNVLTLGLYGIFWIEKTNKFLERIDENTSNPKLAQIILLKITISWIFLFFLLPKYIQFESIIFTNIKILTISLIGFISLNYLYKFSKSLGKVTSTSSLSWYLSIYTGYFSLVLSFFNFIYLIPLYFFFIITPPAMQEALNVTEREVHRRKYAQLFNFHTKEVTKE